MIRTAGLLAALFVLLTSAQAAGNPPDAAAALERKLDGVWKGGPCVGEFTLKADGTFERSHFSPGNYHVTGTWKVRWDALPPTLVLSCRTSDDPDAVGKVSEVKLIQLDDKILAYQYPDQRPVRYTRLEQ
jgi:hypothetical protein